MRNRNSLIIALFGAALMLGSAGAASAATFDQTHPWRAEVNHRLAHQDHRVNRDLRDGRVTPRQARFLHREDRMIRHDERFDARFHRTHLTGAEHRALNQDENGVSRQIHRDVH